VEKLTLDTMLLQDYWKQRPRKDAIERLVKLAGQGRVDLAVTARIREDVSNEPLASEIDKLSELNVRETGSVTRLDSGFSTAIDSAPMILQTTSRSWASVSAKARRFPSGATSTACTRTSLMGGTSS
jgi:hypothetical protein